MLGLYVTIDMSTLGVLTTFNPSGGEIRRTPNAIIRSRPFKLTGHKFEAKNAYLIFIGGADSSSWTQTIGTVNFSLIVFPDIQKENT